MGKLDGSGTGKARSILVCRGASDRRRSRQAVLRATVCSDPALRPLFKGDMTEQSRTLMRMIAVAVNGLDRLDTIAPALKALGVRHAGYGVRDGHYATVGDALLWTLERGLGESFTPDVAEAWGAAYGLLAQTMQSAARDAATS